MIYLARTIVLLAGIFSATLHVFVVFSPLFRLRLLELLLADNKVVRPVKPGFENPLTNNKYQWILGARTTILATDEDALIFSKLAPTLTHSDQFRDFLGTRTLISTAAIIIDSHPPRTVTAKGKENTLHEYAVVDELCFVYTKRGLMCFNSKAMFLGRHKPISAMIPKLSHLLKCCLRSNSVMDIEEMDWAPEYGRNGMIDASVRVRSNTASAEANEIMIPLEFKTGKTAMEHSATKDPDNNRVTQKLKTVVLGLLLTLQISSSKDK
ncbi:hypothetical protein OROMI_001349 [Orobanche minor]